MQRLITVTVLVFAACGTDPVALDDYPAAVRTAFCGYLAKCGDVESVDTCRKTNIGLDIFLGASELAGINMNKIRFDGASAQTCFDALASRSCDLTSQSNRVAPDACLNIARGTLHDAAACTLDDECISLVCNVPSCNMACCMGTCAGDVAPVRAKLGQSCATANCDDRSFCDQVSLTCVALKKTGDPCQGGFECDFGLDCLQQGTCGPLPKLGEPCAGVCRDEGTTCSPATRTCVKVALVGQACNSSADCSLIYVCDATKHCSAGLALGAACTPSQQCADDLAFCDAPVGQAMGVCALPKPEGGTCAFNSDCQSHTCDPVSLKCVPDAVCI
jgi:hypothetical protein